VFGLVQALTRAGNALEKVQIDLQSGVPVCGFSYCCHGNHQLVALLEAGSGQVSEVAANLKARTAERMRSLTGDCLQERPAKPGGQQRKIGAAAPVSL